ncbi:MAG: hypothetical protein WCB12_12525 [Bryobacteraceae bacterium]
MKQSLLIAAALLAGFLGGMLGTRVERARERVYPDQVIRARSFELVDAAGRPISYWGIDKRHNAVLAFGGQWDPKHYVARTGDLTDPRYQGAVFGMVGGSPTLEFNGADGTTRLHMGLSPFEKPLLWMGDETGKRLALGVEHSDTPSAEDNDWYLRFIPDRAWIGMYVVRDRGQQYVKGMLSVSTDKVKYP